MTVASLPMYDADRAAVERWWQGLAGHMRRHAIDAPEALVWPIDLDAHWRDPSLLLSQTCGYPLMHSLGEAVQVVGTPCHDAPGCVGMDYVSHLVVRERDGGRALAVFRGRTVAFNARDSHSGYNALRALVAPLSGQGRFFGGAVASGSHRRSLELIRLGQADIAAVDAVSLAAFRRHEPALTHGLQVIGSTAPAPGLPLITGRHTPPARLTALREALHDAFADPDLAEVRAALGLRGFEVTGRSHYQVIADMRARALALGCAEL